MSGIIKDGTGNAYNAKVNSSNQVSVLSESVPSEGVQSRMGNSFIVYAQCHLSASSSGGLLNILNNDPDNNIEVSRIYIDPHTITPPNLIIHQVFDATISNGTVDTSAIVQKNRGTSTVFNLTVTKSDALSDMTYTSGTTCHSFPVKSMTSTQRNMSQTNIVPSAKSITWGWSTVDGSNAVDGEIISLSINIIKKEREY